MRHSKAGPWPIFVVSLADSANRRDAISKALSELGLPFEFIDAVDGRQTLPKEYDRQIDRSAARRRMGRNLTDGEFACALSHRSIYRRILDEGLDGAVVLEDDAILSEAFRRFYLAADYLEAPLIQLHHQRARARKLPARHLASGTTLHALWDGAYSTAGYSVSREAARFLVNNSEPISGVADWPCNLSKLRPMAALPYVIDHPPFTVQTSYLYGSRKVLIARQRTRLGRLKAILRASYWRGKLIEFRSVRIS